MDIQRLIDNAATASQNDFDDVTREAIVSNIAKPLIIHCIEIATAELRNTSLLLSNPPKSSAAWEIRNALDNLYRSL